MAQQDKHWLLRTPADFYKWFCGFTTFPSQGNCRMLHIRTWFFVGDKFQLLQGRHSDIPQLPLFKPSTPKVTIEFRDDKNGELNTTMSRPERSIRDLILDMIQPGIATGTWKNVQFLDFAHDGSKPTVVHRIEGDTAMTLFVILSLEPTKLPPVGNVLMLQPNQEDPAKHWRVIERQDSHPEMLRLLSKERLWHDMEQEHLDGAFGRVKSGQKATVLEALNEQEVAKYCQNGLSAILAARNKEHASTIKAVCGLLATTKAQRRVFVFLAPSSQPADIDRASLIRDGGHEYEVVGFFLRRASVYFFDATTYGVFQDMIADDGRLKVSWMVIGVNTEVLKGDAWD